MNADRAILHVPFGEDPLHRLAELILDQHSAELPDLSRHVVLFPHGSAIPRFQRILLSHAEIIGFPALLPPYIGPMDTWLRRYTDPKTIPLNDTARELVLYQSLTDFPELRRRFGAWPLIDNLLALFDEMHLNRCHLPENSEHFNRLISTAYGAADRSLTPLDNEAKLIHSLWLAWRQHLTESGCQDAALLKLGRLTKSLELLPKDTRLFFAGFTDLSRAEIEWIQALNARRQLTFLLHTSDINKGGQSDSPFHHILDALSQRGALKDTKNEFTHFLNYAFAPIQEGIAQRAHDMRTWNRESPAIGRLAIYTAPDAEHEARAVDLQVRRWRIQGLENIGIVTNNRKLARRVRALLERANLQLEDAGGWALSTTSAATAMMRWLECLEQNFDSLVLLDLLKSPFVNLDLQHTRLKELILILEQYVVLRYNIAAGMDIFRASLDRSRRQLEKISDSETIDALVSLLDRIEASAEPLRVVMHSHSCPALELLDALTASLARLGLTTSYAMDAAGIQLLQVLDGLRATFHSHNPRMSWSEFHSWLHRHLERSRFRPVLQGGGVELMGLVESRLYRFDAVVVAGCTREHLPGKTSLSPFFNDHVRQQLGLPGLASRSAALFHDFRRLLEAAPRVLITLSREERGEASIPSPWVERIRAFHELAYGQSLEDPELGWHVQSGNTPIAVEDAPLPDSPNRPAPKLAAALTPQTISASTHQRLLNCPYQFYAAQCLNLTEVDAIHEEMEKSEYGERVHRILQAFHTGMSGLPGPWRQRLTTGNRSAAEALLNEISQRIFAQDLERDYSARGWLYRWQQSIPSYLDWEIKGSADWQTVATELVTQQECRIGKAAFTLTGRIDRIDRGKTGSRLIDYKTGAVPELGDIASGEQIQLAHYALLHDHDVSQALFLSFQKDKVRSKPELEGEVLHGLTTAVKNRLFELLQALTREAALPAWGDNETCSYCAMEGLCRKELWQTGQ